MQHASRAVRAVSLALAALVASPLSHAQTSYSGPPRTSWQSTPEPVVTASSAALVTALFADCNGVTVGAATPRGILVDALDRHAEVSVKQTCHRDEFLDLEVIVVDAATRERLATLRRGVDDKAGPSPDCARVRAALATQPRSPALCSYGFRPPPPRAIALDGALDNLNVTGTITDVDRGSFVWVTNGARYTVSGALTCTQGREFYEEKPQSTVEGTIKLMTEDGPNQLYATTMKRPYTSSCRALSDDPNFSSDMTMIAGEIRGKISDFVRAR